VPGGRDRAHLPRLRHQGSERHLLLPAVEQDQLLRRQGDRTARAARLLGRRGLIRAGAALVAACAALTGCGYSRSPVGSVNAPVPRAALLALGFPKAGIAFRFPSNWTRRV